MELFIVACIGVIAWLLYKGHAKPSSLQSTGSVADYLADSGYIDPDALPYDPANPNAGLSPDDPLYIPPVLNPNGGRNS